MRHLERSDSEVERSHPKDQITNSLTPLFSPDTNNLSFKESFSHVQEKIPSETGLRGGKIIGQLRDSYIILQHNTGIQYIDQHALAERIAFEKMKKEITDGQYSSSTLLHPISIQIPHQQDTEQIIS